MPEFVLNRNCKQKLDAFTLGFIEAMFFTNCDVGNDDIETNRLGMQRLTKFSRAMIIRECAEFQKENENLLEEADSREHYNMKRAGADFWFSRQGHGVGYWARKTLDEGDLGDILHQKTKEYGELYSDVQNGWIYLS